MTVGDAIFVAKFAATYPKAFAVSMAVAAATIRNLAIAHTQLIRSGDAEDIESIRNQIREVINLRCPRLKVEFQATVPTVVIWHGKKHKQFIEVA